MVMMTTIIFLLWYYRAHLCECWSPFRKSFWYSPQQRTSLKWKEDKRFLKRIERIKTIIKISYLFLMLPTTNEHSGISKAMLCWRKENTLFQFLMNAVMLPPVLSSLLFNNTSFLCEDMRATACHANDNSPFVSMARQKTSFLCEDLRATACHARAQWCLNPHYPI